MNGQTVTKLFPGRDDREEYLKALVREMFAVGASKEGVAKVADKANRLANEAMDLVQKGLLLKAWIWKGDDLLLIYEMPGVKNTDRWLEHMRLVFGRIKLASIVPIPNELLRVYKEKGATPSKETLEQINSPLDIKEVIEVKNSDHQNHLEIYVKTSQYLGIRKAVGCLSGEIEENNRHEYEACTYVFKMD
jgi:hypothetical protein